MKELTIQQIRLKQEKLKNNIEALLNEYYEDTSVKVVGKIRHGNDGNLKKEDTTIHWCNLVYDNPFATQLTSQSNYEN